MLLCSDPGEPEAIRIRVSYRNSVLRVLKGRKVVSRLIPSVVEFSMLSFLCVLRQHLDHMLEGLRRGHDFETKPYFLKLAHDPVETVIRENLISKSSSSCEHVAEEKEDDAASTTNDSV